MSGSVFDAVVLLAADGLVAVGRVLGRLRRRCDTERRADALAVAEESRECWEPGELARPSLDSLLDAYWKAQSPEVESQALGDLAKYFPDGEWTQGVRADAVRAPEPASHGFSGQCPNVGRICNCTGECLPKRSAAVTVPAADKTTQADHLEAAWHYHAGAVGYAAMRTGGVEWFCEGCNWHGPTKQAHARHRFQVLADMKNATERIQEQLAESTNACVVDGCDFWWHTYEELNAHSRQMHLEPNPFPDGGFRYPGADDVGDFTWHHATTRVQEQLGGTA